MPVITGLEIGSEAVRAAVVETTRSVPILRQFGEMPLPPGAVEAGEIVDDGPVREALVALWKQGKFPNKRVVLGVANQRVIVRHLDVPSLDDAEIVEALPYLVQDAIPIPVEEAVLDFVPVEEFTGPEGDPMLSILTVAAHREMIEDLIDVTAAAGIRLLAVDLQAFGLVRASFGTDLLTTGGGSHALIDIGGSLTQIAIIRDGVIRFVRLLPTGGQQFTRDLAEGLEIDVEAAEDLKRQVGVLPEGVPSGLGDTAAAGAILTATADRLIEDVRGSVNYYLSQSGEPALEKLTVAGNGARLPHLANRIGRVLDTRVEAARVLDHVDVGRLKMTRPELLSYQPVLPAAVGLALWGQYVVPAGQRHDPEMEEESA
ncbi:MAG TPA: type IV pilus assembly protein PilM [Acidimicrobiia bacterium]|nr:type IV pilus assembly protein PilM [Acidimicrobiia bacterium]